MPAAKHNLYIEQGTNFDFEVIYKDSEGNLVNLTGYQARM